MLAIIELKYNANQRCETVLYYINVCIIRFFLIMLSTTFQSYHVEHVYGTLASIRFS